MITSSVQRWRDGRDSYRPRGEPIQTTRYEVVEIMADKPVRAFVEAHHYSATYPAARFRFGLYRGPNLVGVAVFSHPCNDLALRPFSAGTSVELGRFVLLDDVPANGETWFLARAFDILRRKGLAGVVSFSDPMPRTDATNHVLFRGHVGTIYQAFNGVYLGQSAANTLRLLPTGHVLHQRAMSKVRCGERGWRHVVESLVRAGARPLGAEEDPRAWLAAVTEQLTRRVRHPGNLKYAWALDRTARKSLPKSKPYPKMHMFAGAS